MCFGCNWSLTGETTGKIDKIILTYGEDPDTELHYRYTVNGKTYGAFEERDGDVRNYYEDNRIVTVCYDPKDPASSRIFPPGYKCGN